MQRKKLFNIQTISNRHTAGLNLFCCSFCKITIDTYVSIKSNQIEFKYCHPKQLQYIPEQNFFILYQQKLFNGNFQLVLFLDILKPIRQT